MKNIKIAVGMSGGVDSATSAYLLLNKGYDVIGVTMKLYDEYDKFGNIIFPEFISDARNICNTLGIEHYVLDLRKEFEENVINYFCYEYLKGRTPNPCAICNKLIKYGLFFEKSKGYGATHIATGHYAKIIFDKDIKRYKIYKSKIERKDQSYLLSLLSQKQLSKMILPLSDFNSKEEVKNIIKKIYPDLVSKKESNDICFISEKKYGNFIKKKFKNRDFKGNFIDKNGNILGKHKGIFNYTIGQRRGLLDNLNKATYVVKIDPKNNLIILGEERELYSKGFIGKDYNFTLFEKFEEEIFVHIKICQWGYYLPGKIYLDRKRDRIVAMFEEPQRAVAVGQVGVFYMENQVIGGCIIDSVI